MSVFAMFSLKYVSLLDFDTQTESERNNLKSIYGIKEVISDSGLRKVLDKVSWKSLRLLFKEQFIKLETLGILKSYEFLQDYLLVSVDGVEHFISKNVQCDSCLTRNHKSGTVSHSHSMLCAVIVHPNESEVFVIGTEPIQQQDGCQKNDCERSASVRLLNWLSVSYKKKFLIFRRCSIFYRPKYQTN